MTPVTLSTDPADGARHRRALLGLATWSAVAAAPLVEAYARASGSGTLLAAVLVRLATTAQIVAGFMLIAVVLLPLTLAAAGRAALRLVAPLAFAAVYAALLVDREVYALFRFHLNGMVLDLMTTPGGFASLRLTGADLALSAGVGCALLAGAAVGHAFLLRRAARVTPTRPERHAWRTALVTAMTLLVVDRSVYAGADLARRSDALLAADAVPAYGALPARQLSKLLRGGAVGPELLGTSRPRPGSGAPRYPPAPLRFRPEAPWPPIVWILLDSWRGDALDPATTPNIAALAERGVRFERHASGGNSTGFGTFSMFYGLHGVYLDAFSAARTPPAMLSALRARGYEFGVFSSSVLSSPPLRSTVFAEVPDAIHDAFRGDAPARDRAATDGALAFLRAHASAPTSFFLFLFLDSSHAPYDFPPQGAAFEPYARNLAIAEVSSRPRDRVWNRYRNAVRYEDGLVGEVLAALGARASEAIVVISGDHGEAFGEGGHWFHNSGFGEEQWHVPLVVSAPGLERGVRRRLTRHVDVPATVLALAGADAPSIDHALGRSLVAPDAGADHAVVCGLRACAIVEDDGTTTVVPNQGDWSGIEIHGAHYEARPGSEPSRRVASVLEEMRRFVR